MKQLFITLIFLIQPAVYAAELTLVEGGEPRAVIIVAEDVIPALEKVSLENANPTEQTDKIAWAAKDLQNYIEKISGAKLAILGDKQSPELKTQILVGKSNKTKRFKRKIPHGLTNLREEEGYAIISRGKHTLVIAGNDEGPYHGTEYGVYAFLHQLGVRWYMPSEFGEVVPEMNTISIESIEKISRPDFKMRNWWTHWMASDLKAEETRWKIRNGMNLDPMVRVPSDSSVRKVLPPPKEIENPEFSEIFAKGADGRPYPYMPNLSSEKSVQYAADKVKQWFRENPEENSFGIGADDGLPRDYSKGTDVLHMNFPSLIGKFNDPKGKSTTEEWIYWVQRVAKEVRKEFPDKFLVTNGYANRNTPPIGVEPDPTIWIMFAAIFSDTYHALNNPNSWMTTRQYNMLKQWTDLYDNVYMYNYIYFNLIGNGAPPIPLARRHMKEMPLLKKLGIAGFRDEGRTVRGESGIFPTYLRARMMWNADLDANNLMEEYFNNWYGPAAKPAFEFWNTMEQAIESSVFGGNEDHMLSLVFTPELISQVESHLKKAEKLVTGDVWAEPRVKADRATFNYLVAYKAMERAEFNADWQRASDQAQVMNKVLKPAMDISRFYWDIETKETKKKTIGQAHGFYYWGTLQRKAVYDDLVAKTTGEKGKLMAVLPEKARFKIDPRDDGRFDGWYNRDYDDSDWEELKTTIPFFAQGKYLDEQGFPYMGAIWYRLEVNLTAKQAKEQAQLYAMVAETEAWVWVNDKFVGHRPYMDAYLKPSPIDMDISNTLKPGRNRIAIRLHTNYQPAQMAAGLVSRLFIYSPKNEGDNLNSTTVR